MGPASSAVPGSPTVTLCHAALQSRPGAAGAPTDVRKLGKGNPPPIPISLPLFTSKIPGKGMLLLKSAKCWAQLSGGTWGEPKTDLHEALLTAERGSPIAAGRIHPRRAGSILVTVPARPIGVSLARSRRSEHGCSRASLQQDESSAAPRMDLERWSQLGTIPGRERWRRGDRKTQGREM